MKSAAKPATRSTRRSSAAKRRAPAAKPAAALSPEANAFIQAAVADGLAIQHRFKAEPTYGPTGKGYMAPTGVDEIKARKQATKK